MLIVQLRNKNEIITCSKIKYEKEYLVLSGTKQKHSLTGFTTKSKIFSGYTAPYFQKKELFVEYYKETGIYKIPKDNIGVICTPTNEEKLNLFGWWNINLKLAQEKFKELQKIEDQIIVATNNLEYDNILKSVIENRNHQEYINAYSDLGIIKNTWYSLFGGGLEGYKKNNPNKFSAIGLTDSERKMFDDNTTK